MAMAKLKKGDSVVVIAGSQKGKTGEIVKVFPAEQRVIIGGVNKVKRHNRPSAMSAGGIEEKEAPIHVSNVALRDPKDNKPTRVGFKTLKDGSKSRVAKRSGEVISE
jgi:large subunit ribosomal protein L24